LCPVLSLKEENGTLLETFTIITTDPHEIMARIHPRPSFCTHGIITAGSTERKRNNYRSISYDS
jgi:hypothetical protein